MNSRLRACPPRTPVPGQASSQRAGSVARWNPPPRPNTCPPPPRQPPRPGARTTRPAGWPGALRAGSLGGRPGVGAGGGSPAQSRAARGRGCLHSARSFPHARPPCSSWSVRGAGRRGQNLGSGEIWVLMERSCQWWFSFGRGGERENDVDN